MSGGALGRDKVGPGASFAPLRGLAALVVGSGCAVGSSGAASCSLRRRSFSCLSRSFSSLRIVFSLSSSIPPWSSSEMAGEDKLELGHDSMLWCRDRVRMVK